MSVTSMRGIAFLVAFAFSIPALANDSLLRPSPRALAAADEPPPHVDRPTVARPAARPAVALDDSPVYKKWWFWALTAAVVGGTIAFGALTFTPAEPRPRACPATTLACFGDGRPQ
jgi:hypothetical protein